MRKADPFPHAFGAQYDIICAMLNKQQADAYVRAAVPHEAGHIIVGRLLGLKVSGLDHIVIRGPGDKILPGNFATVSMSPTTPEAVRITPPEVLRAYAFFCSAGLAGNLVANIPADEYGLEKDRADLALIAKNSLEEVAKLVIPMIEKNLDMFHRLRDAIQASYDALISDLKIPDGRYPLLTNDQLESIVPQNKMRFPMFFQ